MDRDLPFYFMQVGKWLERVEKMIRMALIILEQHKEIAISLIEADGSFYSIYRRRRSLIYASIAKPIYFMLFNIYYRISISHVQ